MTNLITNATSSFGLTSLDQTAARTVVEIPSADAIINAYDIVTWVAMTTDTVPTVKQADVSATTDIALIAGVALNSVTAVGDIVRVVRQGPAIVSCDDATIAVGDLCTFHATVDGACDGAVGSAALINGDYFGTALSANDVPGTNQVIVDVGSV